MYLWSYNFLWNEDKLSISSSIDVQKKLREMIWQTNIYSEKMPFDVSEFIKLYNFLYDLEI